VVGKIEDTPFILTNIPDFGACMIVDIFIVLYGRQANGGLTKRGICKKEAGKNE
jgi:hypothetical protein